MNLKLKNQSLNTRILTFIASQQSLNSQEQQSRKRSYLIGAYMGPGIRVITFKKMTKEATPSQMKRPPHWGSETSEWKAFELEKISDL